MVRANELRARGTARGEVNELLKDRRLRQGSAAWPAHNGVDRGPFVDWWSRSLLNLEGDEHRRLRRLLNPAFHPRSIDRLVPRFQALADELIEAFAERGRCEFMSRVRRAVRRSA